MAMDRDRESTLPQEPPPQVEGAFSPPAGRRADSTTPLAPEPPPASPHVVDRTRPEPPPAPVQEPPLVAPVQQPPPAARVQQPPPSARVQEPPPAAPVREPPPVARVPAPPHAPKPDGQRMPAAPQQLA